MKLWQQKWKARYRAHQEILHLLERIVGGAMKRTEATKIGIAETTKIVEIGVIAREVLPGVVEEIAVKSVAT